MAEPRRYMPPCACGCEAERPPTVGYWVEARTEYPGGAFSRWGVCGNGALLSLIGVVSMLRRYRASGGPFQQFRIRGRAPKIA